MLLPRTDRPRGRAFSSRTPDHRFRLRRADTAPVWIFSASRWLARVGARAVCETSPGNLKMEITRIWTLARTSVYKILLVCITHVSLNVLSHAFHSLSESKSKLQKEVMLQYRQDMDFISFLFVITLKTGWFRTRKSLPSERAKDMTRETRKMLSFYKHSGCGFQILNLAC